MHGSPRMTWTNNVKLYQHLKTWKQKCALMLGAQLAYIIENQKVKSVLQQFGET